MVKRAQSTALTTRTGRWRRRCRQFLRLNATLPVAVVGEEYFGDCHSFISIGILLAIVQYRRFEVVQIALYRFLRRLAATVTHFATSGTNTYPRVPCKRRQRLLPKVVHCLWHTRSSDIDIKSHKTISSTDTMNAYTLTQEYLHSIAIPETNRVI